MSDNSNGDSAPSPSAMEKAGSGAHETEGTRQVISGGVPKVERSSNFYTRNGVNAESFKKAHYGRGLIEMDRPMWLQALSGLAAIFTWGSVCLAHIRFRHAWKYYGHTLGEIPFQAAFGIYGSYLGLGLNIIVLIAQFYTAISPLGVHGVGTAQGFFQSYLAVPVILLFWAVGYLWKREGVLKLSQIDVDTGRRELDWDDINAYRAEIKSWPKWKRILNKMF